MCPLRNASCLTPDNIPQKKITLIFKFVKLATTMFEKQHLNAEEADMAKDQFDFFLF